MDKLKKICYFFQTNILLTKSHIDTCSNIIKQLLPQCVRQYTVLFALGNNIAFGLRPQAILLPWANNTAYCLPHWGRNCLLFTWVCVDSAGQWICTFISSHVTLNEPMSTQLHTHQRIICIISAQGDMYRQRIGHISFKFKNNFLIKWVLSLMLVC